MTGAELQAIQLGSQVAQVGMQDAKNLRQYNRQRRDNLADWHRQNIYNSPVEQMARLKEAGLNPALMYGKSGGTGQSMSPVPKTEMATGVVPDLNTGLSYAQLELMKRQSENAESQTNLNTLKGATEAQNTALVKQQTAKTGAEAISAGETAKLATELTNAQLQAQLMQTQGTMAKTENIKQATVESKNRVNVANSQLAINLKMSNAQVQNVQANINKINAELKKIGVDTNYMQELIYQTQAKTATEYIQTEIKQMERDGLGTNHVITGAIGQIMRTIKAI
jgi:hypothetical protein